MSSGTRSFDLNLTEIIEEAFELCGLTARSGSDYRSARRSMDLMFIDWANSGTNFWTLKENFADLASGQQEVTLDSSVLDIIEHYTRTGIGTTGQSDLHLKRIGVDEWANLTNKLSKGRPVNIWVEKLKDGPVLHLWPIPQIPYRLVWYELVRIEDTGANPASDADVPWRFLPAMALGLAVRLAVKKAPERLAILEPQYAKSWEHAEASDRERRPTRFSPNLSPYRR